VAVAVFQSVPNSGRPENSGAFKMASMKTDSAVGVDKDEAIDEDWFVECGALFELVGGPQLFSIVH
jgi:hypothetical protein